MSNFKKAQISIEKLEKVIVPPLIFIVFSYNVFGKIWTIGCAGLVVLYELLLFLENNLKGPKVLSLIIEILNSRIFLAIAIGLSVYFKK